MDLNTELKKLKEDQEKMEQKFKLYDRYLKEHGDLLVSIDKKSDKKLGKIHHRIDRLEDL